MLEVLNLHKNYGSFTAVTDVSFTLEPGDVFGFIGSNGAGKTTTIKMLATLLEPTHGTARLDGFDITEHPLEVRKRIGYMPDFFGVYDDMKVIDLLKYSASFYPCDCEERTRELASLMELELNRRIRDLSYGNRKKVGIVQGLLHSPKLVLLDEPTAGLDPLMQRKFFDLIRDENKKGVTVFFSSHILSEVQRLCNRVGIIREGRMVEVSDIRTLQQNNTKKIRVNTRYGQPAFDLPGVTNVVTENGTTQLFFRGDINLILRYLTTLNVDDVSIEEPTLPCCSFSWHSSRASPRKRPP